MKINLKIFGIDISIVRVYTLNEYEREVNGNPTARIRIRKTTPRKNNQ